MHIYAHIHIYIISILCVFIFLFLHVHIYTHIYHTHTSPVCTVQHNNSPACNSIYLFSHNSSMYRHSTAPRQSTQQTRTNRYNTEGLLVCLLTNRQYKSRSSRTAGMTYIFSMYAERKRPRNMSSNQEMNYMKGSSIKHDQQGANLISQGYPQKGGFPH